MSRKKRLVSEEKNRGTAYIVQPLLLARTQGKSASRDIDTVLEEALGLVRSLGLEVTGTKIAKVTKIQAGAFLGKGQREMVGEEIKSLLPEIVIVNHTLSPVQQRNLEKEWKAKVIDRTGLILEIFGARAQTKEGRLQVELAAMAYQRSRLVRAWTHLERQRGGGGFLGGPGETQIELDRRAISEKILRLQKDLEEVRRTRDLGRKSREQVPFPIVALVGYTNAGKSTLFNKLTNAGVFAEDLPFATLDPAMRRIELANGQQAILSDTVGFIADLPTHLIEAFRATLEQIAYANVIVHLIDVSREDHEAQRQDVIKVLKDLGVEYESDSRVIEVFNKVDALDPETRADLQRQVSFSDKKAIVSALTGEGIKEFINLVTDIVSSGRVHARFELKPADGKAVSWLYDHAQVVDRKDMGSKVVMNVVIEPAELGKFTDYYGYKPVVPKAKRSKL